MWGKQAGGIIQEGSAKDLQRMKEGTVMKEQGCSISEAAKRSGVESYVLRYWEEEGILHVRRNRKGHRCYTEAEFAEIHEIQRLKEEGLSLKEIREVQIRNGEGSPLENTEERSSGQQAAAEAERWEITSPETVKTLDTPILSKQPVQTDKETEKKKEKEQQFYQILERVVKEVALTRNREARYRRLDEAIRRQQNTRRMIAATEEAKEADKKKRHMKKRPE